MKTRIQKLATLFFLALMLLPVGGITVNAAQLVVLNAAGGAPVKPGDIVDSEKGLTLKAGASVTLMQSNGSMTTVDGPHEGPIVDSSASEGGGSTLTQALASLVRTDGSDSGRVGAIRAGEGIAGRQELQSVVLEGSGPFCVFKNEGPNLVWDVEKLGDTVTVVRVKDRIGARIVSADGISAWPTGLDPEGRFVAFGNTGGKRFMVTMKPIDRDTTEGAGTLPDLLKNDCNTQALHVIRTTVAENAQQ